MSGIYNNSAPINYAGSINNYRAGCKFNFMPLIINLIWMSVVKLGRPSYTQEYNYYWTSVTQMNWFDFYPKLVRIENCLAQFNLERTTDCYCS